MTEQDKPRCELRWRNENKTYIGLWEGDHCLAAICTTTPRGLLDAQLILWAMNSHEPLLNVCQKIKAASDSNVEDVHVFVTAFNDCYDELEAAIENATILKETAK